MSPGQVQRVRLEVYATGKLRVLVDGTLAIETTADLSAFPSTTTPCIGANAYAGQTFSYDNLLVYRIQ
jgi:hypothetical protein